MATLIKPQIGDPESRAILHENDGYPGRILVTQLLCCTDMALLLVSLITLHIENDAFLTIDVHIKV